MQTWNVMEIVHKEEKLDSEKQIKIAAITESQKLKGTMETTIT